ncbi:hypothetical protein [Aquabacterium commune]|uniref:hypothetical protein n=1 Tax=Aquabacterium commune TaxID=70586 RepID=UPI001060B8D5|nr:hypothetical protein [Aquabacterium commune]
MATAATYIGVKKHFDASTDSIKWYFDQLPALLKDFPYEVCLAYVFLRTEKAQNRTLYCGVAKLHGAHAEVAEAAINKQHLTRDGFHSLYKNVIGHEIPKVTAAKIKEAEKIRDRVVHGKSVKDADMRQAILDVIEYAEMMNKDLKASAGFEPFGDLRGFKGRAQPLEKGTTRWLLKGLGFAIA